MKKFFNLVAILVAVPLLFVSCEKDKEDRTTPPEIYEFSAGTHYPDVSNIIVKTPGAEIIVDFSARSLNDGRLAAYHIEIHDHPASGDPADEFLIIDELFDSNPVFNGLRNASIHKHVAVPEEAPLGEYHVEVVVIDEFGNSTMEEAIIFLVEDTDDK